MIIECPSCGNKAEHTQLMGSPTNKLQDAQDCISEDCLFEISEVDVLWQWIEEHGITDKQKTELLKVLAGMGFLT